MLAGDFFIFQAAMLGDVASSLRIHRPRRLSRSPDPAENPHEVSALPFLQHDALVTAEETCRSNRIPAHGDVGCLMSWVKSPLTETA